MEGVTLAELSEIPMSDTRIVEYRIILPLTVEQYYIGKGYMVNKVTREEKGEAGEGVEIIGIDRFTTESGGFGHRSYKIYHFKSRIPSAVRWAIPDSYLHFHEKSINEWPHSVTTNYIPGLAQDFRLICESMHVPYVHGEPINDNLVNLPPDQLAKREIVYIDIVGHEVKPNPKEIDMDGFTAPELGITEPLVADPKGNSKAPPKWTETFKGPMMCAVKVIKFHFKWFGLQGLANNIVFSMLYPDLFTNTHRKLMMWHKEWSGWTLEEVVKYEQETMEIQGHDFIRDDEPEKK